MEESSSSEDSITDEENEERKPVNGERCWGRLCRSRCCWEAVVQSLVCFLIATIVFLFFLYIRSKDLDEADLCTTWSLLAEGLVLVAAPVGVALMFMVIHWRFKPIPQKTDLERRTDHRLHDVVKEKEGAGKLLSQVHQGVEVQDENCTNGHHEEDYDPDSDLDDHEEEIYQKPVPVLELGSRLQKYWTIDDSKTIVISTAKRSQLCMLTTEEFDQVNKFLSCMSHSYIQKITSVKLLVSIEFGSQVIISQPFWIRGSLRDLIHRVMDPMADWDDKYRADSGRPLATEKVAVYGSHILQAMIYLYKQKFSNYLPLCPLGQVQSGNIFIVDEDNCVLGGYENILLSYRTSLYGTIAHYNLLDYIDIIMFGHVVYEMCTGHSLRNVIPTEDEYERVEDVECLETLRYIFKRNKQGHLTHSIKKISKHKFFLGTSGKSTKLQKTEKRSVSKVSFKATSAQDFISAAFSVSEHGDLHSSTLDRRVSRSKSISKDTAMIQRAKSFGKATAKSIKRRARSLSPQRRRQSASLFAEASPEAEGSSSDSETGMNRETMDPVLESQPLPFQSRQSDSLPLTLSNSTINLSEEDELEVSSIASGGTKHIIKQKYMQYTRPKAKFGSK